jgi:predicted metal-dependent TIM-barrel fold hydrolase
MCENNHQTSNHPSHFENQNDSNEIPTHVELKWDEFQEKIRGFRFFDPHIHMVSRTTDDYQNMAQAGIIAVIEPAFWVGQPRTGLSTFKDYYSSLVGWERFRSSQFGIKHYCTIGLNSREANNERLADEVMEILPLYIYKEGVVGIGEIGFDDQTELEEKYYRLQLELAKEAKLPVQIHTPHRDKKRGTERSMSIALEHGLDPSFVVVDHNNEETVKSVLDQGFYAAFTIYPFTKMGNKRMVSIVEEYGAEKIMINSSADWGISDPLAIPKTAALMVSRGISHDVIRKVTYENAIEAFAKSGQIHVSDFENGLSSDPSDKFHGNSVLRGGQQPKRNQNSLFID